MTRLFLRFYVGVVGILILGWLIQSWLTGERFASQNAQVVRDALFGGVRNARDKYRFGLERGFEGPLLAEIKDQFDYPVKLLDIDPAQRFDIRLADGRREGFGNGAFILARVGDGSPSTMLFGPLPRLPQPSLPELLTGAGAIFLFAAIAIALLLRPVVKQFQDVEQAAAAIASGDLAARIERQNGIRSSNLGRAFNNMASRTEAMVRSQRELLQAVSHELRTPLSRIHFAIDLIKSGDENTREQRLNSLTTAADDLDDLVGELISYVRLEGTESEVVSGVDPGSLVKDVVRKFAPQYPDVKFTISDSLQESQIRARLEPAGFDRVVSNLVSNAVKYCRSRVDVRATTEDRQLVLCVDDDGPGVVEEDRERILEPFVRAAESKGGVGLGLSIVRRIVEQHGGGIRVLSSPIGGCRIETRWKVEASVS